MTRKHRRIHEKPRMGHGRAHSAEKSLSFCRLTQQLSLSRLNHWLPRCETHPEVVQGTAQFHHEITDALLPQPDPIFHNATALHTTVDMFDPEPALVQGLVRHVLRQR